MKQSAPAPTLRRSIALDESRPLWRNLAIFLVPLMLSNVLQSLGQSANAVYLGHLVGVRSLAAVSAIFPLVFFLVSFLIGIGAGASVLIGQAYGAGDREKVRQIAGTALALSILLGAIVGAVGAIFTEPLLRLLAVPPDILAISASYARIVFISIPLPFVYLVYTTFLRGVGDTRTPFIVLIASTVLTFALTPLFIKGFAGLPPLETNGAAAGNIVATLAAFVMMLALLRRQRSPLALDLDLLRNVRIRPQLAATIARIGIPTSINLAMVSLSEIAVLAFVDRFGASALAAYGAVNQITSYVQFPAISIGIAASIFSAQSIGAGRVERIATIVRSAVALNYAIEGALILAVYAFSTSIIKLFITAPHTVEIAHGLLAIILWSFALFGNARVLSAIMISSGAVIWPTVISVASVWLIEVPVAYVLMVRIGLDGVWIGYPAAYVSGLLLQYAYYQIFWKKRTLKRLV